MMTREEMVMYDMLIEMNIATAEEISLVRQVASGSWTEIFNAIVYARTGWRTLEDYIVEELAGDDTYNLDIF